ncbi:MAG: nucleotidyltransferase substrate binding protein [Candidatus Schekmanbacteria bacterium]|nr:nucleotidyltransferase substrate binding protein [Candidatus Schekmanbacteria bacterium]
MALDLSSLKKALACLESALQVATPGKMEAFDEDLQDVVKAGIIQNFEFCYELCWKFLQRWIALNKSPEDAEPRTRKDLFRMAARYGLIKNPLAWFEYSAARNLTVHTYDQVKADTVGKAKAAVPFLDDAKYLLAQLEALND